LKEAILNENKNEIISINDNIDGINNLIETINQSSLDKIFIILDNIEKKIKSLTILNKDKENIVTIIDKIKLEKNKIVKKEVKVETI